MPRVWPTPAPATITTPSPRSEPLLPAIPTNSQYQLSLARALRDSNDPRRLDEAESYLIALWQRSPQDGAVNLALGRVAAHRGSIEDATRYYHNAMYGVWNSDPDINRSRARVELIEFLLQEGRSRQSRIRVDGLGRCHCRPIRLRTCRPRSCLPRPTTTLALSPSTGRFSASIPRHAEALAGAGAAAYRSGRYMAAQRYLAEAMKTIRRMSLLASFSRPPI